MKIAHAASELFPFAKTGGLADAVGALAGSLAKLGHEVAVFLPGYRAVLEHPLFAKAERRALMKIELGKHFLSADLYELRLEKGLTLFVIRRDEFYDRSQLYGASHRDYEDNDRRFIFFSKAVVEGMRLAEFKADILHCHDWQAGLAPLFLRMEEGRSEETLADKTVFTIHNIAFQGLFPAATFGLTNLPAEFMGIEGIEYYGQMSMLKAGLVFADRIATVSPTYSREIQTAAFGCGMEGVVSARRDDLSGLINGIDDDIWNPATDPALVATYSADELKGKAKCKRALLASRGWDESFKGPVFGMICRLTEQKGVDLVLSNADFFIEQDCRLVILGSGDPRLEKALAEFAALHKDKVAVSLTVDEPESHRIEAGADFFLMPSLFEPCGLNQMYSQRYGTVPVVARVGGLADTVIDIDEDPHHGTGLMFAPTAEALRGALDRALQLYADRPRMRSAISRGMKRDFSWRTAARAYEQLYRDIV
jgi:starch synthase